ncbi:HD-GYP domain-containing protein [Zoogloea sp. 1C4]|uniref:HD-GYP domain-containing protein n=1 Tax=Zoogloea sp. 1C4 TaxID=2570190 RepID=UPI001D179A96|nr:HD-GYP domain-containing protein [Zoogloea sp. 1C4]
MPLAARTMPPEPPQDHLVTPEQLCVGLFVHLDLPWFSHPFSFNSFKIRSADQLKTLRELGVTRFRYDPERSDVQPRGTAPAAPAAPPPPPVEEDPATCAALAAKRERIARLAQRKRQVIEVEKAFVKAAGVMRNINKNLFARPKECLEEVDELVNQMVVAFLDQPEAALHVMGEHAAGEEAYFHGLNVSILSMMLAKDLGFSRSQSQLLGVGALLHDIGLADIPERIARARHELTTPERNLRELHCEYGVRLGKQIGLPEPVLRIIAQHHELADGSGYPRHLKGDQIDPLARLVALVNYYDNLCNPGDLAKALTPHEALSMMFAQRRNKFDGQALQVMIRSLGVYPPGSVVRLSNDALALVSSVNPVKPLRPWVTVFDPDIPRDEAIMLDLEQEPDINIAKALRPIHLPPDVYEYLSPRKRVTYYFDADSRQGRNP